MAKDFRNHREHFPPDRVWIFLDGEAKLSLSEQFHLAKCDECQKVLRVCAEAKNSGWLSSIARAQELTTT